MNHRPYRFFMSCLLRMALFGPLFLAACQKQADSPAHAHSAPDHPSPAHAFSAPETLFRERARERWTAFRGRVERLLSDDTRPPRHQRFLVRTLPDRHPLLVVHNTDLAPRIPLAVGDMLTVQGLFVHNDKGGIIHYTHRATRGRRGDGFVVAEKTGEKYW